MKTSIRRRFLIIFSLSIFIIITTLQTWNYYSSLNLLEKNENDQLQFTSNFITNEMSTQIAIAEHSLSAIIHSPEVKQLFANEDRESLLTYLEETYAELERKGIDQLQFHTADATSFLRVHQPEKYGDDLSKFRKTVIDANQNKEIIKGLEEGVAGYGFRVVSPIEYDGEHIGTVEVGANFGKEFLDSIKHNVDGDYYIYSFSNDPQSYLVATNDKDPYTIDENIIEEMKQTGKPTITYSNDEKHSIMLVPFFDYTNELKGYIKGALSREEALLHTNKLIFTSSLGNIASLLIIFTVTYFLVNTITVPVTSVAQSMERVAEKDLTIDTIMAKRNDEIGQLSNGLNKMVDNLRTTLSSVNEASQQVAASSEQLLASAEETSKASEQVSKSIADSAERREAQLGNINDITVTIDKMSTGMGQILKDSEELLEKTERVSDVVQTGNISVNNIVSQMNLIDKSVDDLTDVIQNLNVRTNEIDQIVQFITEISAQTNLLALNAAIEAARAGEAGQGFAVVADEVRDLAEEVENSAVQIMDLIRTIQGETENAVTVLSDNSDKVDEGLEIAENVNNAFQQIAHSITDVNEFTEEVTSSVETMASGSEQVVEAIENIRKVAEANAANDMETSAASEQQVASMEEISSAAEVLAKLAVDLQNEINEFKL